MKINKANAYIYFVIFFLVYIGFYAILLLGINLKLPSITEIISIPIRMLILAFCVLLLLLNLKKIKWPNILFCYLIFSSLYFIRILIDYNQLKPLYINYSQLVLYYLTFSFIPFFIISIFSLNKQIIRFIYKGFFLSSLLFAGLASVLYGQYLGNVSRLASGIINDSVISPLILSYCSTLGIGVIIMYLIYNKVSFKAKLLSWVVIILNIIPFLLGASRGSIIALVLPFVIFMISKSSAKTFLKGIFLLIFFVIGLYFVDTYFEASLFERFLSIGEDIESGSSSSSRVIIWNYSWEQFLNNPFFGDKLQTNNIDIYPHNIILEILQSVGLVGFIPFMLLLIYSFRICYKVFRSFPQYSWIPVVFIQAFSQNLFSGAVYTASWFWITMALLIALNRFLKYEK